MDQKALPLLVNEFNNMGALTDKYLKITVSRDYIAPDSLSRDPLEQKVLTCWHSLESMASSNQLVDDGSCQQASKELGSRAGLRFCDENAEQNVRLKRISGSVVADQLTDQVAARSSSVNV